MYKSNLALIPIIVFVVHVVHSIRQTPEQPKQETLPEEILEVEKTFKASSDPDTPATIISGTAHCACGISPLSVSTMIVGGELAQINNYPWTALLTYKGYDEAFCGGTLICDRYVVSGAHCMKNVYGPEDVEIWLMEQDLEKPDENVQPTIKVDVSQLLMHPDWNPKKIDNDIVLLKLTTPVNITKGSTNAITPACVPANNDHTFAGLNATVVGWGAIGYGMPMMSQLRKVQVPVFEQEVCRTETVYKKYLTENMLCAGYLEGGKDACTGDSGGPLVVQQNGNFVHVGIVSFGHQCAKPKAPGVYARVGRFGEWIQENTKDCKYCSNA